MTIYLAKTLENMKKYGPIFDLSMEPSERVAEYTFGEEENEWFLSEHVDNINAICDTMLDDGDVDFFDINACRKLIVYLKGIDEKKILPTCVKVYETLMKCAQKAISYQTGIEIEL